MDCRLRILDVLLIGTLVAGACAPRGEVSPERAKLSINVRYPMDTTSIEMGQSLRCIMEVTDEGGEAAKDAQVTLTVQDAEGAALGNVTADFGSGDVYRSSAWTVPHKSHAGMWTITVHAVTRSAEGTASARFQVINSLSETLLAKYGFWVEDLSLQGITTSLVKEQGDAQNGVIIWGGVRAAQHIFPESWLDVQWRQGDFKLGTSDEVRRFMLGTLGDLGFTPVRELGPFERVKFKGWDAWHVKARGSLAQYDEQWMIFYAPEAKKTYAIGTTVAQAPAGIDAHAALRDSFEVHPEIAAQGVASEALPDLLPPPELVEPALGARFVGTEEPITLSWKPVRYLAADEYYQVRIDYNYEEANTVVDYVTRQAEYRIPKALYEQPNCGVFNWQVTLMKGSGRQADGQVDGEAISYDSLYWYIRWDYPPGAPAPFKPLCPNPQY
jgi:hypothetical protein